MTDYDRVARELRIVRWLDRLLYWGVVFIVCAGVWELLKWIITGRS